LAVSFTAGFAAIEVAVVGGPLPISSLGGGVVGRMIQIVLSAGLYNVALQQIDGGGVGGGGGFWVVRGWPALLLGGVLTFLGTFFGFLCLIIPGLVFAALVMFTTPAVVDGLGAIEALKRSIGTLKREWLSAIVFLLVTGMILAAGSLLFGVGLL